MGEDWAEKEGWYCESLSECLLFLLPVVAVVDTGLPLTRSGESGRSGPGSLDGNLKAGGGSIVGLAFKRCY